jgi:sterol O-acyltransferase
MASVMAQEAISPLELDREIGQTYHSSSLDSISALASPLSTPASSAIEGGYLEGPGVESRARNRARKYILSASETEIRELLEERLEREREAEGLDLDGIFIAGQDASGKTKETFVTRKSISKRQRVRLRDILFTQRHSAFDRQNPLNSDSPFFGFFTLFWLSMTLLLLKIAAQNYRTTGSVLGKAEILHLMFERDIIVLGVTDAVMVGSTIFSFLLQKTVQYKWISWRRTGWVVQNIWQTAFLFAVLAWMWMRDWPWTHTIFMVLHTLVFVMKQHSFAFYNGYCKIHIHSALF